MNEQVLSLRLARVGAYVPENARLADIGSDHAYLPVALLLQNKITFAVAGEVVQGPYESAKRQVEKSGLTDKIVVRLANGLAAIQPADQIDAITIAGMGGTLIRSILADGRAQLTGQERLILQPNIGEKVLREWLQENNYQILHEEILEEHQKIYEIIVAEKTERPTTYSERELFFGPLLVKERNPIFLQKWQQELRQKERVLAQIQQATNVPAKKSQALVTQIDWIKEVLA